MLRVLSALALCCAPTLAQGPAVVINEFRYTDTGPQDDHEFVELYNASSQTVDLSGWTLEAADASQPDDNPDYVIRQGTLLQPGATWVLGSPLVSGVDQPLRNPATQQPVDLFENDTESLTLRDPLGRIVDTVVYEGRRGVWDPSLVEGEPIWGDHEGADFAGTTWSRLRDGWDTGDNGRDFVLRAATPGLSNDLPTLPPLVEDFDQLQAGLPVLGWTGTPGRFEVIDPTQVSSNNPRAIPASPQGGLAAALGAGPGRGPTGSTVTLRARTSDSPGFEALVYIDSTPLPQGSRRSWSIGLRGTSDILAAPPAPGTSPAIRSASGNTGVAWVYVADSRGTSLYLVDHGSGGERNERVIARIRIVPGQRDGWQRLRLLSSGERIHATFGGQSPDDGEQYTGSTTDALGDVYLNYHQSDATSAASALRLDRLRIIPRSGDRSASGGSGCTGNCPIGNPKPKKVDTRTAAEMSSGQYAMRVAFDPAEPYTVLRLCFWTSKFDFDVGGVPTVSIHAVDGTGLAPAPVPVATLPLLPPMGATGSLEGWWATPEFGPVVPTEDFFIAFDYDPTNDGVHPPIGVEGDPLQCHYRPTSTGPFTLLAPDLPWAWAVVCPTETAEPVPADLAPPLVGTRYHLEVQGARPSAPAFLTLGIFDTVWNGLPLPFDLGVLGAPGCRIYTSVEDALGAVTGPAGATSIRIPIPNDPNLAGVTLFEQWLVLDPRANRLGLTTSEKVSTTIGVFY